MDLENIGKNVIQSRRLVIIIFCVLPFVYFLWFVVVNGNSLSEDPQKWGEFGDFIGGILNPLIAIFAIYWLTFSILIQKQELSETREALEKSQQAQNRQAELALTAARVQSLSIRLNIINSELSAYLDLRNVAASAQPGQNTLLDESGTWRNSEQIVKELNPKVKALKKSQTELIRDIEILIDKT